MRKIQYPLIFILIAALILSACTAAPVTQQPPEVGNTPTVGTEATSVPVTGATEMATEPAGEVATLAATEEAEVTSTEPATTPEVTEAATEAAGTPEAGVTPETGTTTPQAQAPVPGQADLFVRLSEVMAANVNSQDGTQVGEVDAVLIERPVVPEVVVEEMAEGETPTPAPSPTPLPPEENRFFVRYVVVNVAGAQTSSEGNEVIVPWQAFAMDTGLGQDTMTLNVDSDVFTNAPHTKLVDIAQGSATFSEEVVQYWSDAGVIIPAAGTGTEDTENMVLVPDDGGVIGVTGPAEEFIDNVSDMLIVPDSGEVQYVVFSGGDLLGDRVFIVPVSVLTWVTGELRTTITNRGNLKFNFPTETLENAPTIESLEDLQLNEELTETLNNFWEQIQGREGSQ